jgi:hypothetical protein
MRPKDSVVLTYVLVIFMVAILFVSGVLAGNYLAQNRLGNTQILEEELRTQTIGAEIQYRLLIQQPCDYLNADSLSQQLRDIESRLNQLELERGTKDAEVMRMKNQYTILEIQHYLFTMRSRDYCTVQDIPILYFYSQDCEVCAQQGNILTSIRESHPYVRVYSFDVGLSNPALDLLKQKFDISSTPKVVVINQTYGFSSESDLANLVE